MTMHYTADLFTIGRRFDTFAFATTTFWHERRSTVDECKCVDAFPHHCRRDGCWGQGVSCWNCGCGRHRNNRTSITPSFRLHFLGRPTLLDRSFKARRRCTCLKLALSRLFSLSQRIFCAKRIGRRHATHEVVDNGCVALYPLILSKLYAVLD